MKAAVIIFPGSNCDRDAMVALRLVTGKDPLVLWHRDRDLPPVDLLVLPGGFSHGDYLRAGAMAARAPIMRAVVQAAAAGVPVLGICNGFQILTESGLLPGALIRNSGLRFVCRDVALRVDRADTRFSSHYRAGEIVHMPVAHHDGHYVADDEVLDRLEGEGRVLFRYVDDVNGSRRNIAGIMNEAGNVLGLMPHPERAVEDTHPGQDGQRLFASLLAQI